VGYDATNYLRVGTRRSAVSGALAELGYRRFRSEQGVHAFWMEPIGPEHIAGIVAVIRETNGRVAVHTHTTVWASAADTPISPRDGSSPVLVEVSLPRAAVSCSVISAG
jgi:hypothetical protein